MRILHGVFPRENRKIKSIQFETTKLFEPRSGSMLNIPSYTLGHVKGKTVTETSTIVEKYPWHFPEKNGWGSSARFVKPLAYFRQKPVIFPSPFQTLSQSGTCRCSKHSVGVDKLGIVSSKDIPNSRSECTNRTLF